MCKYKGRTLYAQSISMTIMMTSTTHIRCSPRPYLDDLDYDAVTRDSDAVSVGVIVCLALGLRNV